MGDSGLSKGRLIAGVVLMLGLMGVGLFLASSQGPGGSELQVIEQRERMIEAARAAELAYQQSEQQLTAEQYSAVMSAHYNSYGN